MTVRGSMMAVAAIAAVGLAGQAARADSRDFTADGSRLSVIEACAHHVTIAVDPTLTDRIAVTANAAHPEEIAQLAVTGIDGQARVGLNPGQHECWRPHPDGSFAPTLTLDIRVPATFPISIAESGLGDYTLGSVGPLTLSASGKLTLAADAVSGNSRFDVAGAGSIVITRLDADRLAVSLSGAGSLQVRQGRIGNVRVSDSGTANVRIDPVVETASLSTSGIGSITLGGVRGSLARASSGLGRITVAGRAVEGPNDADDHDDDRSEQGRQ